MLTHDRWLLPEGIDDIFPHEARALEQLGRTLMDRLSVWGYRQVIPPMVDFLDSLLVGTGHALDLETLKLSDPVSGRLIGLRADMTPQVARIDARTARVGIPARFCYLGSVIRGLSGHLDKTRNPIQIGAELFGDASEAATTEVIHLLLETLALVRVDNVHLDLGHVGIYRLLASEAGLGETEESELFDILQRKDPTDLRVFLADRQVAPGPSVLIERLLDLNGPLDVLDQALEALAPGGPLILKAVEEVAKIGRRLTASFPSLQLHVDLAELRGYQYHTGIVFAAFVPGQGQEIARGGRYDEIGQAFGHARPAVGFSADLRMLASLCALKGQYESVAAIFAPAIEDADLEVAISQLRGEGVIVIQSLGGPHETAERLDCSASLRRLEGRWQVIQND
ncbi:MAG: ATP phosphoribosyltransferase regulatory subunit [Methylococcus sp.]|jgi:ATP phosphoribosyltransferase regulatory subunit|nr:MAG: ATP phosphoribosyltransferase regulatory subunit [Methylococcus sp.]